MAAKALVGTERREANCLSAEGRRMLKDWIEPLRGELCWGVEWDPQRNLSMHFGEPSLYVVREPCRIRSGTKRERRSAMKRSVQVQGRAWLWLSLASWTISRKGENPVIMSSSGRRRCEAFQDLDGQKLQDVEILSAKGTTRFTFDLDTVLTVRRMRGCTDDADDIWLLYGPHDRVLSLQRDGTLVYERYLGD